MTNCCYIKTLATALLLFTAVASKAQLSHLFAGSVEPTLALESNFSKLLSRQVQFSGYGLGFNWESGLSLGLVYYHMGSKVITPKYSQPAGAEWRLYMNYISLLTKYNLLNQNNWLIDAQLGNGWGKVNLKDNKIQKDKYNVYVCEPAVNAQYNILNWLGLYSQLGFRLAVPGGPLTLRDYSSLKFNIGFTIIPIPFYHAVKNNTLFE
ncbi:hypothetical protein GC194_07790 [bacterium]|nr:hypothetical protein [bacterium]